MPEKLGGQMLDNYLKNFEPAKYASISYAAILIKAFKELTMKTEYLLSLI
jgi:hypothetical protein